MSGCSVVSVGTDNNPPHIKSEGVLNGYMACNGFRQYDGVILDVGVLSDDDRWGDFVSIDLWPVAGAGVSFFGARVKILPFEFGLGVLGYEPEPESYANEENPKATATTTEVEDCP